MNNIQKIRQLEDIGFEAIKRPDLPAVKISLPFDWTSDPFSDENWCFQLHTLRWLRPYINEYIQTQNIIYLIKAYKVIDDWSRYEHESEGAAWGDMASGIRSEVIYELLEQIAKVSILALEKSILEGIAYTHHQALATPGFINVKHNHGLFALHGLNCLNQYFKDANVSKIVEDFFIQILERQFDEEGVHTEHSPHYHYFITATVDKYLSTGLYENMTTLRKNVAKYKENCKGLVCHRGFELPFGDTDNQSVPSGYILSEEDVLTQFSKSGYSVFREEVGNKIGTLAATNNNNSHTHKHSDNLSFIWFLNETELLIDPGKYTYNKQDPKRSQVLSSDYHNTITICNEPWNHKTITPILSKASKISNVSTIEMRADAKVGTKPSNHKLTLCRLIESDIISYVLITDEVFSEELISCTSRLFFHPDAEVTINNNYALIRINGVSIMLSSTCSGIVVEPELIEGIYSKKYNEISVTSGIQFAFESNSKLHVELRLL